MPPRRDRPRTAWCQPGRRETHRPPATSRRNPADRCTKRGPTPAGRRRKILVTPPPGSVPDHETARTPIDSAVPPIDTAVGDETSAPDAGTKRNDRPDDWPWSKNDGGIINWHIDHLRVSRQDLDDRVGHINNLSVVNPLHYGVRDSDDL